MSIAKLFPARPREQEIEPQRAADHPATAKFLNYHAELEAQVRDLVAVVDEGNIACATLRHQLAFERQEYAKMRVECDQYRKGYFELKAQLSIVATSAINAAKTVADVSLAALETTKHEMQRAGIFATASTPDDGTEEDDGTEAIGRKFGAGTGDPIEPRAASAGHG